MSDHASTPRPVSLFTVIAVFLGFALFALALRWFNLPAASPAPHNLTAEKLPEDLKWKATPATRRETFAAFKDAQGKQAVAPAAWLDKKAGTVQLPIDRAMALVVQENAARK